MLLLKLILKWIPSVGLRNKQGFPTVTGGKDSVSQSYFEVVSYSQDSEKSFCQY